MKEINNIFIEDLSVCTKKKVLVRLDWNVPVDAQGNPVDTTRITKTFHLLEQLTLTGATVIVISHLGEKGESLQGVATFVASKLPFVSFIPHTTLDEVKTFLSQQAEGHIYVLENIRLFKGELENDLSFAEQMAELGQIYINDAFSVAHRNQASVVSIPKYALSYAGPLFKEEVTHLMPLLTPTLPTLFIVAGAKISTKLSLIKAYLDKGADVFVGGAMVHTILKQRGYEIGKSLYDENYTVPEEVLNHPHLLTPVDVVTSDKETREIKDIPQDGVIVDCGKQTIINLTKYVEGAHTIIMNGPLGLYEDGFKEGTESLLTLIGENTHATTVLGGGDTLTVLEKMEKKPKFSFISLAGGAMLTYLTEGTLPGIEALR